MSAEISPTFSMTVVNGNFTDSVDTQDGTINQAAQGGGVPGVVSVTTSEGDITLTGLSDPAVVFMKNLDLSNYVKYGPKSGGAIVPMGRLLPGGWCFFTLQTGVTLRMQADTATCKVQIKAYER